ncbi:MAG: CvpA family protein [Bacteroidaceae bacterium]|nr:CvpA family protein [Bacteroidaceae bacterium]
MDILLLILLAVGFVTGLISGAVRQVISLVAFVIGFVIACLYYQPLGEMLSRAVPMPTFCQVVAFLLLWIIVPIAARILGTFLTSLLDGLIALGMLNRLLGGILGVAKYALVLGALIWFLSSVNVIKEETMQESQLCQPLKAVPEYIMKSLTLNPLPERGE